MNKNDDAWGKLFEKHDILGEIKKAGKFEITASQINVFRESRLMTKFDHLANLPEIFDQHHLTILPITRGSYVIGDFDAYHKQPYDKSLKLEEYEFPAQIESINPNNIFSESAAINCAYITGMISDLVGEDVLPTVSGRMGTSKFSFRIKRKAGANFHHLGVDNSQCEIDGGFEGPSVLALIEAKNAISEDFIVRQLYYPYRLWSEKTSKKVMSVFLSYSNDVFHFFIYEFIDKNDYNSIKLVEQRNCAIAPEKISLEDIQKILNDAQVRDEPQEPFPQADKFERVVDLLNILARGDMDGQEITVNYDFDPRQTKYYTSAAKYLGLLEQEGNQYLLSRSGFQILNLSHKSKYLALAKSILAHRAFNRTCALYLGKAERPDMREVVQIMKDSNLHGVSSDTTFERRSQTVVKWVEWIFALQS